jgi:uncharacterized membrane protein YgdD (TMEM256/DUF423 family)
MGKWLAAAGLNGLLGVGFGAWAAHGAVNLIGAPATEWVKTGAQYQLWHAAALLALALAPGEWSRFRAWAGGCFCLGALLFSGSLYALALGSVPATGSWLVFITPFGGLLMLAGWAIVLVYGLVKWRAQR